MKDTFKASLGKEEVTDIEIESFIVAGAKRAARDAMSTCTKLHRQRMGQKDGLPLENAKVIL